jgi:hypothetical protein
MTLSSATGFEREFPFQKEIPEQIHFLLHAATRAPSTHNSQPWQFKIENNRLFVYRDASIKLPLSDSVNRYSYISIGFLIHHIKLLGEWLSMNPHITLVGRDNCVAEIIFSHAMKSGGIPPLVEAIFKRRNRRGNFEMSSIPQTVFDEAITMEHPPFIPPEIQIVSDKDSLLSIAEATSTNMKRVYKNSAFRREMASWITSNNSSRKNGLPGYSLNQPMIMSWILPTIIRLINIGKVLAGLNKTAIASAAVAFGFGAPDEPSGWVSVGYTASHAALTLVAHDFDYSVFVAAIESNDTRESIGKLFNFRQPLEFIFVAGTLMGKADWMTPRMSVDVKLIAS